MKLKGISDEGMRRIAQAVSGDSDTESRLQALDFNVEDTGGGCTAWVWFDNETDAEIMVASDVSHVIAPEDFGQTLSIGLYKGGEIVYDEMPASADELFLLIDGYQHEANSWSQAHAH